MLLISPITCSKKLHVKIEGNGNLGGNLPQVLLIASEKVRMGIKVAVVTGDQSSFLFIITVGIL